MSPDCTAAFALLPCSLAIPADASPALTLQAVDSLARVYPDQPLPASPPPDVFHVPPAGHISLQVAIQIARDCSVTLAPGPITRAGKIRRRIVRTHREYEKSPGAYHRARRALLTELDRLTKPSSG